VQRVQCFDAAFAKLLLPLVVIVNKMQQKLINSLGTFDSCIVRAYIPSSFPVLGGCAVATEQVKTHRK